MNIPRDWIKGNYFGTVITATDITCPEPPEGFEHIAFAADREMLSVLGDDLWRDALDEAA